MIAFPKNVVSLWRAFAKASAPTYRKNKTNVVFLWHHTAFRNKNYLKL